MSSGPAFSWDIENHADKLFLCIVDLYSEDHPTMSVTNGVDRVLKHTERMCPAMPDYVIYRDTLGRWDRINMNENWEFKDFAPCVTGMIFTEKDDAIKGILMNEP